MRNFLLKYLTFFLSQKENLLRSYLNLNRHLITNKKTILVVKTDAIGDYLLFRPYLCYIREYFFDHRIILLGNESWKELALALDSDYIDHFVWLKKKNTNGLPSKEDWTKSILAVCKYKFDFAFYFVFSRENIAGDKIMKFITAKQKWAFEGDFINQDNESLKNNNKTYHKLIKTKSIHDLYKNHEFVESILGVKLNRKVSFNLKLQPTSRQNYILLCPSASKENKKWSSENWIKLIIFFLKNTDKQIYVIGGNDISNLSNQINNTFDDIRLKNLICKTSLMDVLNLIVQSEFIVTNDSMPVHLGIQTGTITFCIYKGNHFGRFLPYPSAEHLYLCCPEELNELSYNVKVNSFKENEGLDISRVTFELVLNQINCFLNE